VALTGMLAGFVFVPGLLAQATTPESATTPAVIDTSATIPATLTAPLPPVSDATATTSATVVTPLPASADSQPKPADPTQDALQAAYHSYITGDLDTALDKVSALIKIDSRNKQAFLLRGSIYAQQKQWDKAEYDYEVAHVLDPNSAMIIFDQAELKFMQKKYDDARTGFLGVQNDKDLGDFATFKVFLCDLFGNHQDVAAKELDALNQVGGNPSYYFGNAAWDLVHNKTDAASDWLKSAGRIYANAPQKISNYTASLTSLGYLPIKSNSTE